MWVEPDQACGEWRSEADRSCGEEVSRVRQLCDPSLSPTLEDIVRVFPSPLSLPPPAYWPLVRRLAGERGFWAHAQLAQLLAAGAVADSDLGEVLGRAVEQGDWALVSLAVRHSHSVPEPTLATLLQSALDLPEEVESHGESLTREGILWQLLRLPYSDALLQGPFSHLPLSSVLSLLQLLAPHVSVASLSRPPPLPYPRLLDWLALLLDSHWPGLALSPAASDLLTHCRHSSYHQMLFCENLATVGHMLEAARKPRQRRQRRQQPITVERLKLKI
jgi:hypothetical protein